MFRDFIKKRCYGLIGTLYRFNKLGIVSLDREEIIAIGYRIGFKEGYQKAKENQITTVYWKEDNNAS